LITNKFTTNLIINRAKSMARRQPKKKLPFLPLFIRGQSLVADILPSPKAFHFFLNFSKNQKTFSLEVKTSAIIRGHLT